MLTGEEETSLLPSSKRPRKVAPLYYEPALEAPAGASAAVYTVESVSSVDTRHQCMLYCTLFHSLLQ